MARLSRKQVRLLGGAVVIVMIAISVAYYFSWRYWGEFQTMMGDEFVQRAGAAALGTESVTYNLVEGWNLKVSAA